jgi:hypothetical protein
MEKKQNILTFRLKILNNRADVVENGHWEGINLTKFFRIQ